MFLPQSHAHVHENLTHEIVPEHLRRVVDYYAKATAPVEEAIAIAFQLKATQSVALGVAREILTRRGEPLPQGLASIVSRLAPSRETDPCDQVEAEPAGVGVQPGQPGPKMVATTSMRYVAFPTHLFGQLQPVEMAVIQAVTSHIIRPYDRAAKELLLEATVTCAWLRAFVNASERTIRDAIRKLEDRHMLKSEMAGRDGIRLVLSPALFLSGHNSPKRRMYAPVPSAVDGLLDPNERAVLTALVGLCGARIYERLHAGEHLVADTNFKALASMAGVSRTTVRRTLKSLAAKEFVTYRTALGVLLGEFTILPAVFGKFGTVPDLPTNPETPSKSADYAADHLHVHERENMKERPARADAGGVSILERFRIYALVATAFRPNSQHRTDVDRARIGRCVNLLDRMCAGVSLVRDVVEHLREMCRRPVPPERILAEVARLFARTMRTSPRIPPPDSHRFLKRLPDATRI